MMYSLLIVLYVVGAVGEHASARTLSRTDAEMRARRLVLAVALRTARGDPYMFATSPVTRLAHSHHSSVLHFDSGLG